MVTWEYKTLEKVKHQDCRPYSFKQELSDENFNELGADGWEMVSALFDGEGDIVKAVFKRPNSGV